MKRLFFGSGLVAVEEQVWCVSNYYPMVCTFIDGFHFFFSIGNFNLKRTPILPKCTRYWRKRNIISYKMGLDPRRSGHVRSRRKTTRTKIIGL